jgi:hypothetical protein
VFYQLGYPVTGNRTQLTDTLDFFGVSCFCTIKSFIDALQLKEREIE